MLLVVYPSESKSSPSTVLNEPRDFSLHVYVLSEFRIMNNLQVHGKYYFPQTLVDILGDAQPAPPARNHDDFWSSSGGATATYAQPTRNNDPWASGAPDLPPPPSNDPWGAPAGPPGYPEPTARDPWSGAQTASIATTPADNDPWAPPVAGGSSAGASPWGSPPMPPLPQEDVEFDALMTRPTTSPPTVKDDLDIRPMSMQHSQPEMMNGGRQRSKTPQDFLGGHSGLVDIDNLVTAPKPPGATNPFAPGAAPSNPFMAQQTAQVRPTLNQMQSQQRSQFAAPPGGAYPNLQQPMMPDQSHNPFM